MNAAFHAYNESLKTCPLHHDGKPRKAWAALPELVQRYWAKNTAAAVYPTQGTVFYLPDGWTVEDMAAHRKRWTVPAHFAPVALTASVVAWGTPLPSSFTIAQ
jgi:hypothetical protein